MSILQSLENYVKAKFNAINFADPAKAAEEAGDLLLKELAAGLADVQERLTKLEAGGQPAAAPAPTNAAGEPVAVVTQDQHETFAAEIKTGLADLAARIEGLFGQSPAPAAPVIDPTVTPQTVVDTTGGTPPAPTASAASPTV